jgi:hypothetical protein
MMQLRKETNKPEFKIISRKQRFKQLAKLRKNVLKTRKSIVLYFLEY